MRMEKNGAYLSNFGNEKSCKTKGKNKKKTTVHTNFTHVDEDVSYWDIG